MQSGTDDKVSKFIEAINEDANRRKLRIEREIEDFNRDEMEKAANQALEEAYYLIRRETAAMRADYNSKISAREADGRRELMQKRDEITAKLFGNVKEKLISFSHTKEYKKSLLKSVEKMAGLLPGSGAVIYVKPEDMALEEDLRKAFGRDCGVEPDPSIEIGGARGRCEKAHKIADDTLDVRLKNQREWFLNNSGLTV